MTEENATEKIAFDYAWGWFSLHAGQRMQGVNFFLIAIAFLAASYVSAVVGDRPGLAVGISALGAFSSFIFYRIERRVRGLIHAAEKALRPLEKNMAICTGIPEMQIVESVEIAPKGSWPYSRVFRALYAAVGSTFVLGAIYAGLSKVISMQQNLNIPQIPRLLSGIGLLIFAYCTLRLRIAEAAKYGMWVEAVNQVTRISLAVLAALAGGLILIRMSF